MDGFITAYDGQNLYIKVRYDNTADYVKKGYRTAKVILLDGRNISADQRKKIYATLRDIAEWTGYADEEVKNIFKILYLCKTGGEWFSLSDCSMTEAKDFLEYLIEFCVENGIPTKDSMIERAPDIARYIYICCINKRCCITGKKAELHHEHAVGMGRNRKEIIHKGMSVMPLCREMHTECHTIGQKSFNEKYHVFGVVADDAICKAYKLKKGE